VDLNGTWLMRDFDPGGGEAGDALASRPDEARWMQARVPGDVHSALLEARLIPDPFYDRNIEKGQWIEDREWWFRKTFAGPSQPGDGETRDLLTFDGLDTFATVYLNGEPLGDHANMFRPAIFDVTERLTAEGLNTLAVSTR
jgi:beta-mannosidase